MKTLARLGAIMLMLTCGVSWADTLTKFGFDAIGDLALIIICCVLFMLVYLWEKDDCARLCRIFWPMALTVVWIFLPFPGVSAIFLAGCSGWTMYRWLATQSRPRFLPPQQYALPLTMLLTTLCCTAGIIASSGAYQKMFLVMSDWGLYAQTSFNTWHGEIMRGTWPVPTFSEGHFMPGFFFLFAPIYGLMPSPYTAFVCGALLLWGSAPLLYLLARKVDLTPWQSCGCAVVWLLAPSVSNMNLCIFYGFNAIYLFIPVLILFYLCCQKKYYKTALVLFFYSLLIKETVCIFWLGWGCVTFMEGKRKTGIACAVIGAAGFLLATKILIPAFAADGYIFYNQYGHLGNGMVDIILSPVLRPDVFWSQLLRWNNLFFVVMLLLPVFPAAFNRPWLLLAGAPIIFFHFLRGSETIVNIFQHYQTENIIMITIAMILGLQKVTPEQRWPRWLLTGLPVVPDTATVKRAMLGGTLISAAVCHLFFAETDHTFNRFLLMQKYRSAANIADEIKAVIPPGTAVSADQVTAPQFLFRNRLHGLAYPDGDYATFGLGHYVNPPADELKSILNSDRWELKWHKNQNSRSFYVYQKVAHKSVAPPRLPQGMPNDVFGRGIKIKMNNVYDDFFAFTAQRHADRLQISVYQIKPFDKFIGFAIAAVDQNNNVYEEQKFFGDALVSPEKIPVFSLDTINIALPADAQIKNIAITPVLL